MSGLEAISAWGALMMAGFLGHLVGDYILQTGWQAALKANRILWFERHVTVDWLHLRAITGHALSWGASVTLFMGIPAWVAFGRQAIGSVLIAGAILAVLHWIQDRRWPVKWLMRVTGHDPNLTWLLIVFDNTLHLLQIAIAAAWIVWRV